MADRTIKPDDTNDLVLQNNDGSAKLELNEDQTVKVTTGSDAGEDFSVNTSQLVVEGDTGNVGIGATPSGAKLHIEGSNNAGSQIKLKNTGGGGSEFFVCAESGSSVLSIRNSSSADKLTVAGDSNGDVTVKTGNLVIGTTGKGIDFSVNTHQSGGTSELLDFYEEGSFTPIARSESGSASKFGVYTKIGNVCHFKIHCFNIGSTGGSLEFSITNLPFTAQNNSNVEASCAVGPLYKIDSPTSHMQLGAKVGSNGPNIFFYWGNDDATYTIATCANFDASDCSILVSGSYQTA